MPGETTMISSFRRIFGQLMTSASMRPISFAFGAICTYVSSHINAISFTIRSYIFSFIHIRFVSGFNQIIGLIIPTLLVFFQLKYQSNDSETAFTTHPYTMGVAVVSNFMYHLACVVHKRYSFRRFSVLSRNCMTWFGDISVASLLSIFFPDGVRPILYVVFGLIAASEFLQKLFVEETGGAFWVQGRRIRRFGTI